MLSINLKVANALGLNVPSPERTRFEKKRSKIKPDRRTHAPQQATGAVVVDAVGTPITERPPHRTVRAAFPHTAPTSGV